MPTGFFAALLRWTQMKHMKCHKPNSIYQTSWNCTNPGISEDWLYQSMSGNCGFHARLRQISPVWRRKLLPDHQYWPCWPWFVKGLQILCTRRKIRYTSVTEHLLAHLGSSITGISSVLGHMYNWETWSLMKSCSPACQSSTMTTKSVSFPTIV
jgi:hypothetical protein